MIRTHTLNRSHQHPLSFRGHLLAENKGNAGSQRRHVLRLYETDGGMTIVGIEYRSDIPGERNWYEAHIVNDIDTAHRILNAYNPAAHAISGPLRPASLRAVRREYEAQVRHLMACVGRMPEESLTAQG